MKTASAYHIGRRHEQAGEKYQDAVQYYHDDYITIIAVADGCSSAKAAKEAADINVQTAVDFLKSENAWRISSKKAFKAALLDKIEEAFRQVPFETDELSATLAAVAIRSDGMFTAFSVGDGTIVTFDTQLSPCIFIEPYNAGAKNRTCFTNDREGCMMTMQLWSNRMQELGYTGFSIFTDGADFLVHYPLDGGRQLRCAAACTALGNGKTFTQDLVNYIAETYTKDDVSAAFLIMDDEEICEKAQQILNYETELISRSASLPEEIPDVPAIYQPLFRELRQSPLSPEELVEKGYCPAGKVLSTMRPLLNQKLIIWRENAFALAEDGGTA